MTDDERRADGGLLTPGTAGDGTWTGDELHRALVRIEALGRELQFLETGLRTQQDEMARLAASVQTVDGRTQRHEAGQEQTREVRQEIAQLEQRLAEESALRRELAAQLERAQRREAETQRELQRVLEVIAGRLDDFDGRMVAERERQRAIAADVVEVEQDGDGVQARLERLEHRVAADVEGARHVGAEVARLASAVTQLLSTADAVEARTRGMQADQRRLDEELAALRAVRSREEELLDLVEQQRATRARLEDRVSGVEESLEELRRAIATGAEERQVLARQVAGEVEQRRAIGERMEAQRDAFLEHLRRQARADEDARRRMIEELERDIRVTRGLVTRISEQAEDAGQEQPL